MELNIGEVAGTLLAAASGAAASFLAMRKKFSQDSSSIAEDRAETSLLQTLMAERNVAVASAREAWAQRTEDARAIARFEALLEASKAETKRLHEQLFALRLHIRKLTTIIVKLDPAASAMLHLDNDHDGLEDLVQTPVGGS